jgi:hypothetical protein
MTTTSLPKLKAEVNPHPNRCAHSSSSGPPPVIDRSSRLVRSARRLRPSRALSPPPFFARRLSTFFQLCLFFFGLCLCQFRHACITPDYAKKMKDQHGPLHQDKFPDYIHFVHIPKAGGTSFTKVLPSFSL